MKTIEHLHATDGRSVQLQKIESGEYLMTGPTGTHTIASNSSPARVSAHWDGFCSMNDVRNEAQRRLAANPKSIDSSRRAERELKRCRYLMALIEARIDGDEAAALNFKSSWANVGDAENLRDNLLQIVSPDGEPQPHSELLNEIDADIGYLETEPRYELEDKPEDDK